ncbi:unnamed protein product [Ceutorhynchus assimilis]|uniref:Uncharacterized protein n=1 Tax=Ceutorhynchus assimilis TaxID=467358 RepID=A0A9N9QLT5_9CUCU|nr:unnamed protein product [Ceutorhynchus assimilis]
MMKKVFLILCILAFFHNATSTLNVNTKELEASLKSFDARAVAKDISNTILKLPARVITNLETLIKRKRNPEASEIINAVNSALDLKLFTIKDNYVELDEIEIEKYFRLGKAIRQFYVAPRVKKVSTKDITAVIANNNEIQHRLSLAPILLDICESILIPLVGSICSSLSLIVWILVGFEMFFTALGDLVPESQGMDVTMAVIRDYIEATHKELSIVQGDDICGAFEGESIGGVQEVLVHFWVVFSSSVDSILAPISQLIGTIIAGLMDFSP